MKGFYPTKDFAASLIVTSNPGTGGTTFNVTGGEGTKFPDPATDGAFRAYVWPNGVDPTPANCEEVEVTAKSTDALTVVRSKNGVSLNVLIGYQFAINYGKSREDQFKNTIPLYSIARQALINGNFDIWQRRTTKTGPTHASYPAADRWRFDMAVDGGTDPTMIVSRQELTPGDILGSFYFHRLNVNGAGASYGSNSFHQLTQSIEHGVRHLCGLNKTVTIRFKARSSISGKKLGISITESYGTGGSPSGTESINGQFVTLTSTWTEYTFTFTTNTLVGKTFGTNVDDRLILQFWFQWGAALQAVIGDSTSESFVGSGNIDIAAVQLCSGDVPLDFIPRTYDEELNLCQRYYYKNLADDLYSIFGMGLCETTSAGVVYIQHPKRMRVAPAFAYNNPVVVVDKSGTSVALTSLTDWTDANGSPRGTTLLFNVSGTPLVAGDATILRAGNDATAYIEFDAEL